MIVIDELGKEFVTLRETASLRIFGDTFNPEEISLLLSCQPSNCYKKGERKVSITGSKKSNLNNEFRTYKKCAWFLDSDLAEHIVIEDHIKHILKKVTQDLTVWKDITDKYEVDIYCGLFLSVLNTGFDLSSEVMKMLSERNLAMGFDIYCEMDHADD